jgi:benzoyl-CoA 2,3-dioxygenase component B
MDSINYNDRIPNNVDLSGDRRLQRALEKWQPAYLQWWRDMGPEGLQEQDIYLRTAIGVDTKGWAHFGFTKMPDYRWGIFLHPRDKDRTIGFGDDKGAPVWQEVPGEHRAALRRIIVVQGDTEPASVEQQRFLGQTCPSLYDLRSLLQVNVEEGRHLWAMVYLLHAHFGRDGREQADELLERRSGDSDRPRILEAFNELTPDWLSFFMFTYFTDRDGKFQLAALSESAFDPLARSCRFMLKEESYHMYVGETGITRVVERTAQTMRDNPGVDPRNLGVIDLETIQRYLNFHHSVTLDLFGAEISTNSANNYTSGLKGRYHEGRLDDGHVLRNAVYPVIQPDNGELVSVDTPALSALNERLRDDFIADVSIGVRKWNRLLRDYGIDMELSLPHRGFNRNIGLFRDVHLTPTGDFISAQEWDRRKSSWLPTPDDMAYVCSLMIKATVEPGEFASWIAPPARGIDKRPIEFDYIRFA